MTLIERLEAAEEGSRELDAEIALAIRAPQEYFSRFDKDTDGYPWPGWSDVDGPECYDDAIWGGGGRGWTAPQYTTSIDAALTLIPKDPANPGKTMLWSIAYDEDGVAGARSYCAALGKGYHDPEFIYGHHDTSPATALVIAALKAREVKE